MVFLFSKYQAYTLQPSVFQVSQLPEILEMMSAMEFLFKVVGADIFSSE